MITEDKAPIFIRGIAFLIDHMIILLIGIALALPTVNFSEGKSILFDNLAVGAIFFIFLCIFYFVRDFIGGRGPGKTIFGLGVVNTEFEIPSKFQLAMRNITLVIWPIEFLATLLDKDGRRISDRIFKTKVIKDKPFNAKSLLFIAIPVIAIIVLCFVIFGQGMKEHPAYRAIPAIVKNDENVKKQIGQFESLGFMSSAEIGGDTARFQITLKGTDKNHSFYICLVKNVEGDWIKHEIESLNR